MLKIKRAYAPVEADDGFRILVDRLWPRGESKLKEHLGAWEKEIAPSNDLRHAFHDGEIDYQQFAESYRSELRSNPNLSSFENLIKEKLKEGPVTLVYGSKDTEHNNAVVLLDVLRNDLELS